MQQSASQADTAYLKITQALKSCLNANDMPQVPDNGHCKTLSENITCGCEVQKGAHKWKKQPINYEQSNNAQ